MGIDLTANGKLTVDPHVTERKVSEMASLVDAARRPGIEGDVARLRLKETLTTSDAPFAYAHLLNVANLPQYEETVPVFDPIVTKQIVPDFKKATFYSLDFNFDNLKNGSGTGGQNVSPTVAEGAAYTYAFGYTSEEVSVAIEKQGFKLGLTLEHFVNDIFNTATNAPQRMLDIAKKTEAWKIHQALVAGVDAGEALGAGTDFVTGNAVAANADISAAAIRVALAQLATRVDARGNRKKLADRYFLVVPLNQADSVNWMLSVARGLYSVQDGPLQYAPTGTDPLSRIQGVIEDEFLTDNDAWYMVPASGAVSRPALLQLQLNGYTIPEVYVSNFNGAPVLGGASSNAFQAFSFDNDTVTLKLRQFTQAVVFNADSIVWSNGSGTP